MPDATYKPYNFLFSSKGIIARKVDDTASIEEFLNLDNCEELAENAFSGRLGSTLINAQGSIGQAVYPLDGIVRTVTKLNSLNGTAFRYAGTSAGTLWRISGLNPGAYTQLTTSLSGNPMWAVAAAPSAVINTPFMFFADGTRMMKDNGTLAAPQQSGIFQPQFPVQAQAQVPDEIVLDPAIGSTYTTSGIGGFSPNLVLLGPYTTAAITTLGIQNVPVGNPEMIGLFQSLVVDVGGNQETVLVIGVTATGFIANFTKLHPTNTLCAMYGWSGTVPASGTATVSFSFGGTPISAWPTTLQQADYIGIWIYVSEQTQVQSIQLAFDCGDGTFTQNYFYKVIAQGPLQSLLNTASVNSTEATTAATDALLNQSLGLYGNSAGSIAQLNTAAGWTPLLIQLSDFAGAGRADFNDPVFNWSNVNGYRVTITANDNASPVVVEVGSLILFGGAGPDSFAGVGYDYLFTFFNNVDWTESNPCMSMSNVNPPNATNWVYPRRQPVLLTMSHYLTTLAGPVPNLDPQTTSIRIYRKGGTLGDNYRRVDEIPCSGLSTTYLDTTSDQDLEGADFISFVNDVPVTSPLPVPVNTTLATAIVGTNQLISVSPASMANISLNQQVSIGSPTALANNFETVIVTKIILNPVTPHQPIAFQAFVQNAHAVGETISATAQYGKPVTGMALAFGQMWYWGDSNNPSYLYWSAKNNPQYVSSAAYIDTGSPDDPLTIGIPYKGNFYISAAKAGWQSVAPGSNANGSPTIYPTACKHGNVAPFGAVATEEAIFYQAIDGIRAFAGGASDYLTQELEFIYQNVGASPIVEADQTKLQQSLMAYWNNMIFNSYIGQDGNRHRIILHTQYKRFRNDDFDCQSIFLEVDTNQLIVGDSNGLVHIDRQILPYDQANVAGLLAAGPIPINLQSSYQNQGLPANQKNYNNLQIDCATSGQPLTITLLFNDGQESLVLGTATNAQRGKINFPINAGRGQQAYKVGLQITGNLTKAVYIYQASLEALPLPMTRKAFDTYDLNCGGTDSKMARDIFWQYSAGDVITVNVYYDSSPTLGFTFKMPQAGGIRNPLRQRLPAVSFRTIRFVGTSNADFMLWQDSCLWYKFQCQGRGYEKALFIEN